jgi:speckle-type POZ protein
MATAAASPLAASDETTRSAIVAGNVTGHHQLDIEGYSLIKELLPSGKSTNSQRFRVGGRLWYISLYPNGQKREVADFISIYVHLVVESSGDMLVKAQVTWSLLDQAGNPVPSYISTTGLKEYSGKSSHGVPRFIKREILENSEHLKDDRFTIKCDISMKKLQAEERTVTSPLLVDSPPSDLHQHLGNLLISQEGADVTFQVAGETFSAHRYILAARSPVLKAEIFGSMRESDPTAVVEVSDVEPQVFRALLQFIYTDAMPEMTREEPVVCQHLFVSADRYGMDKLKLMCEDRLSRSVDVGSVANILTLADQHSCHVLRKTCIQFLESRDALSAVLATDDFEQLCRSCPSAQGAAF